MLVEDGCLEGPAMPESKATVLVIDDEPSVRGALEKLLTRSGYQVRLAADGREALELVTSGPPPDVIVLDLMMPVMTGFEVLSAMRVNQRWATIPVIVLTGTAGYSADHLGVVATLEKPFDIEQIKAAIELALDEK
jgi:CheY-like chemotaxis protein